MSTEGIDARRFEEELYSLLALRDAPLTMSVLQAQFPAKDERQILRALMKLRRRGQVLMKRHILNPRREPEFVATTRALMERHRIQIIF